MTFGAPRDAAPWIALGLALLAVPAAARLARIRRRWWLLPLAAAAAASLSAAYVVFYLRGGPRIIDASSYWLEARAMASGLLAWPLPEPEASMMGRFLVRAEGPDGPTAAVIFPPGYPALLALGFVAGAPLAVGPLLAAALVVATYALARRVAKVPAEGATVATRAADRLVPATAAALSMVCAALRYHTADTMSHGLAALCWTGSLALVWRAVDVDGGPGAVDDSAVAIRRGASTGAGAPSGARRSALTAAALAGALAGWLVATRPASALALVPVLALALRGSARRPGSTSRAALAAAMVLGALPGLVLLVAHQRAATGAFGVSAQSLYYATSDGPPGCFGYRLGDGIGCVGEHGDFVRARLAGGYGSVAALGTTLRRLKQHLVDAGNVELGALVVLAGMAIARREARPRLLVIGVGLQVLAYVPFYFDGNYPAGGARFYADVLPLEHVLMAIAAARLGRSGAGPGLRGRIARLDPAVRGGIVVAVALLGFGVRTGFDHAQLRDRDGGRPMLEEAPLEAARQAGAMVFIDTDHGYNLALDPGRAGAAGELAVARFRDDHHDWLAWEARGRPPAFRYRYDVGATGEATARLTPLVPSNPVGGFRFEGESMWPAHSQRAAWALPEFATDTCVLGGRWLAIHRERSGSATRPAASIRVGLPARAVAGARVIPRLVWPAWPSDARGRVRLLVDGADVVEPWHIESPSPAGSSSSAGGVPRCDALAPRTVPGDVTVALELAIELDAAAGEPRDGPALGLDAVDVHAGKGH